MAITLRLPQVLSKYFPFMNSDVLTIELHFGCIYFKVVTLIVENRDNLQLYIEKLLIMES